MQLEKKIGLLLLFLCSSVFAQEWEGAFGGGGMLSIFKLWGGPIDRSSVSYGLYLDGRYGLTPSLLLGAELGYKTFKPALWGTSAVANTASPFRTFLFPVNLSIRYTPLPEVAVKPYAVGTLGLMFWDLSRVGPHDGNVIDNGALRWGKSVYGTQTDVTLGIGGGFEWFVTKNMALDFEVRNTFLLGKRKDNVGEVDANDKLFQGRFGVIYYANRTARPQTALLEAVESRAVTAEETSVVEPVIEQTVPVKEVQPPPPVEPVSAPLPQKSGSAIVLVGVNFEIGSADLTPGAREVLEQTAKSLLENPEVRVLIEGHTDNTGPELLNQKLSVERAEKVKEFLVSRGVAADRLETAGRGPHSPIADNSTPEGKALNRRIEFRRLD